MDFQGRPIDPDLIKLSKSMSMTRHVATMFERAESRWVSAANTLREQELEKKSDFKTELNLPPKAITDPIRMGSEDGT